MASLKGTRTEKNLLTAFAGESQARMRYTYFASQAKKDGYVSRFLQFLPKLPTRKKSMQSAFLNFLKAESSKFPALFLPVSLAAHSKT